MALRLVLLGLAALLVGGLGLALAGPGGGPPPVVALPSGPAPARAAASDDPFYTTLTADDVARGVWALAEAGFDPAPLAADIDAARRAREAVDTLRAERRQRRETLTARWAAVAARLGPERVAAVVAAGRPGPAGGGPR